MHTASPQQHSEVHTAPADGEAILEVQFDDLEQQHQTSILGMWLFLATEVLFFGGLITAYVVYRSTSVREFELASRHMAVWLGFLNPAEVAAGNGWTEWLHQLSQDKRAARLCLRPHQKSLAALQGGEGGA